MSESRSNSGRRKFLMGLLTGAGVTAALGLSGKKATAAPKKKSKTTEPILYRRTEDVERYYKTLYT